jgi:protein-S-isoprenylcysteine O-methyltransferase Ste14
LLNNQKGEWWLLAQVVLICAHILPTWPSELFQAWSWAVVLHVTGLMVFAVGLGLALQGFLALGPNLSPLPDPKPNAVLITTGVYRHCRHPLYRAVLICSVGVVLAKGSLLHLALLLILVAVLNGKAHREEKRLCSVHPDYLTYRANTPAILPGLPGLDWRQD